MSDIISAVHKALREGQLKFNERSPYDEIVVADVRALILRLERQLCSRLVEATGPRTVTLLGIRVTESPYVLQGKAVLMRGGEAVAIVDIGSLE